MDYLKKHTTIPRLLVAVLVVWGLALALNGCAIQPEIKSNEDKLAVAYGTVTGVANSVKMYVDAGLLSAEDARGYSDGLHSVKDSLDAASIAFRDGLPDDGVAALQLASEALFRLQLRLQKQIQAEGGGS